MAQTLTRILIHVVFSTKDRIPLITPEIEPELWPYMAAIGRSNESPVLAIGGVADHVHLILSQSKNVALKDLLMVIKKDSSKWLKTKGPQFREFHWQDGYGGFSIGESQRKQVTAYIGRQKIKHQTVTFQEEFLTLLKRYQVPYDERYIWT